MSLYIYTLTDLHTNLLVTWSVWCLICNLDSMSDPNNNTLKQCLRMNVATTSTCIVRVTLEFWMNHHYMDYSVGIKLKHSHVTLLKYPIGALYNTGPTTEPCYNPWSQTFFTALSGSRAMSGTLASTISENRFRMRFADLCRRRISYW